MKKFIVTFLFFLLCSVSAVISAQSYTGLLTVYVNGQEASKQSTVVVTKGTNTATLKIDDFKYASYSVMTITLDSAWNSNGSLTTPGTLTVAPPTMSFLLGKLEITDSNIGTLTDTGCALNLKIYSPTLKQNIRVVFDGTLAQ